MAPVLPKTGMIELEARAILSKLTESCTAKELLMDIQLPKKSIADFGHQIARMSASCQSSLYSKYRRRVNRPMDVGFALIVLVWMSESCQ